MHTHLLPHSITQLHNTYTCQGASVTEHIKLKANYARALQKKMFLYIYIYVEPSICSSECINTHHALYYCVHFEQCNRTLTLLWLVAYLNGQVYRLGQPASSLPPPPPLLLVLFLVLELQREYTSSLMQHKIGFPSKCMYGVYGLSMYAGIYIHYLVSAQNHLVQ